MINYNQEQLSAEDQKKYKEILLKTMKSFDHFCKKHGLKYIGAYGTVLGAIRHKGLIPWDDDIDVYMLREDYEKFLSLRRDDSLGDYEILDDSLYGYYLPYAKYCDAKTTIWERQQYKTVIGVFIDVFPVDYVNNVNQSQNLHIEYKKIYQKYSYATQHLLTKDLKKPRGLLKKVWCKILFNKINQEKKHLETSIKNVSGTNLMFYSTDVPFKRAIMPQTWFDDLVEVPYENLSMPVPKAFDEYLKMNYGDYMTPPPPEKRISHHYHYFVDLNKRLTIKEINRIKKNVR